MLLWLLFAVVTAAVLAAVLAPLARPAREEEAGAPSGAFAVYRHQLDEVEAERARGIIDAAEADAARIEISRRLLANADPQSSPPAPRGLVESRCASVALAAAVVVPLFTVAVYLIHGSPGMPSLPVSARAPVPLDQARLGELIAKVEARLREHPEDGEGWDVIAPVYFKLERFRDAATAYAQAARLKGETVKRLAGLAEASMLAADGIVTEEARAAYEKIVKVEPKRPEPRFWLALTKEQDGKLGEALADYKALLAEAPPDAPWRKPLAERVGDVTRRIGAAAKGEPQPGPSAADVAAASKLSPDLRAQMIAQMVEGLAQRLKQDGADLAGWQRLVNAYVVLGRKDDALAALSDARRNFSGNDQALGELSALAQSLGLGS